MTDSTPVLSRPEQKRLLRRRIWALFGLGLVVVLVGALLVAPLSQVQVGVVNQVMTMVVCFLPVLLVLLVAWLALAAAMFGVSRLEISVTRQLSGLEARAQSAESRARAAGDAMSRQVRRAVAPIDRLLTRLPTFEADDAKADSAPDKDVSHEQ